MITTTTTTDQPQPTRLPTLPDLAADWQPTNRLTDLADACWQLAADKAALDRLLLPGPMHGWLADRATELAAALDGQAAAAELATVAGWLAAWLPAITSWHPAAPGSLADQAADLTELAGSRPVPLTDLATAADHLAAELLAADQSADWQPHESLPNAAEDYAGWLTDLAARLEAAACCLPTWLAVADRPGQVAALLPEADQLATVIAQSAADYGSSSQVKINQAVAGCQVAASQLATAVARLPIAAASYCRG